jgi:predicted nucleic acid-binding Zn ribbon protein
MMSDITPTTCDSCGQPFTPTRSDARFCSDPCRVRAHRQQRISQGAVLVNEVVDNHGRSTRLWVSAKPASGGLLHFLLTSTFSGAQRPEDHRIVWQTSLPTESLKVIRDVIDDSLKEERKIPL